MENWGTLVYWLILFKYIFKNIESMKIHITPFPYDTHRITRPSILLTFF